MIRRHAFTVADAVAWPVVHVETFDDSHAVLGEELQVARLRGFVRVFKCEADADYHLEIAGSRTPKAKRVIVEVPSSVACRAGLAQGRLALGSTGSRPRRSVDDADPRKRL